MEAEFLEAQVFNGVVMYRCTVVFHPGQGSWIHEPQMLNHLEKWFILHKISPTSAPRVLRELADQAKAVK